MKQVLFWDDLDINRPGDLSHKGYGKGARRSLARAGWKHSQKKIKK